MYSFGDLESDCKLTVPDLISDFLGEKIDIEWPASGFLGYDLTILDRCHYLGEIRQ